jgi:cytochrome bd ubiquinol oxidase subunit I
MAAVLAPLQLVVGDQHGLQVARYQPAKLAAIEGHWENNGPAPLVLFAVPNEAAERNDLEVAIPNGASLIITHSLEGTFPGLKDFAPEDRPPVDWPFYAFRVMVGIGLLMIATALTGAWLWWRGRLETTRWFLRLASITWPAGFVALLSGWTVVEVGRQPWVATGILRTIAAASPVPAAAVAASLVLFVVVYLIVFAAGLYYMNRLINRGPSGEDTQPAKGVASRPLSAAEGARPQAIGIGGGGS